jgi:hypothetical protein
MIKVRQRGELERKYRYLREEKIFKPMKRFRNQKRSELNEVEKRKNGAGCSGGGGGGHFITLLTAALLYRMCFSIFDSRRRRLLFQSSSSSSIIPMTHMIGVRV